MLHVQHPPEPECLSQYQHGRDNWGSLSEDHRRALHQILRQVQQGRCAYCEASAPDDAHIDHFRQRRSSASPELTFTWSNLLLSCTRDECCRHKDQHRYTPEDLIDPASEDARQHLHFSSNGEIRPKTSRGLATLRILNLNDRRLKELRCDAIRSLAQPPFPDLIGQADFQDLVDQELAAQHGQPFESTLIAYLTGA